jgi:large subunit ribosomal protein L29
MKTVEIKDFTTKELEERLQDEKANIIRYKMNHAVSPLDNPQKIKRTRKIIARISTELVQRTLSQKQ